MGYRPPGWLPVAFLSAQRRTGPRGLRRHPHGVGGGVSVAAAVSSATARALGADPGDRSRGSAAGTPRGHLRLAPCPALPFQPTGARRSGVVAVGRAQPVAEAKSQAAGGARWKDGWCCREEVPDGLQEQIFHHEYFCSV